MFTEGYSFPHPVLGNDDDISGEFNISFVVSRNDNRKITLENTSIEITNRYISQQIENGNASIFIKVYCSSTLTSWVFQTSDSFEIDENDVVNRLEIQALIITTSEILNYTDDSFNIQYGDEVFTLNKNEVIGVSGKMQILIPKVNEKLGLGNIFKFNYHDKDKPIEFELHHDKIFINYPVTEKGEHPPNLLFSTKPWTAFNIFIVPALSEAFKLIDEDIEEASKWNWYFVIDQLLPEDQRTGNYFIDAQTLLQTGIPILLASKELSEN